MDRIVWSWMIAHLPHLRFILPSLYNRPFLPTSISAINWSLELWGGFNHIFIILLCKLFTSIAFIESQFLINVGVSWGHCTGTVLVLSLSLYITVFHLDFFFQIPQSIEIVISMLLIFRTIISRFMFSVHLVPQLVKKFSRRNIKSHDNCVRLGRRWQVCYWFKMACWWDVKFWTERLVKISQMQFL